MSESALDYVVFIILLVVVTAISFGLIIPVSNNCKEMYYTETYDKTANKLYGENAKQVDIVELSIAESSYSFDKIVMQIMSQNYYLPKIYTDDTTYINIGEEKIAVQNNESDSNNDAVARIAKQYIKNWYTKYKASTSYSKMMYTNENAEDAMYQIRYSVIGTGAKDNKGNEIKPCYALFILGLSTEDYTNDMAISGRPYKRLYRCMENGLLTTMEGKTV